MEGRARSDQAIIDHFSQCLMVRRPGRGQTLEKEDNDEYQSRMDNPPEYIVDAIMRQNERERATSVPLGRHACLPAVTSVLLGQHAWLPAQLI